MKTATKNKEKNEEYGRRKKDKRVLYDLYTLIFVMSLNFVENFIGRRESVERSHDHVLETWWKWLWEWVENAIFEKMEKGNWRCEKSNDPHLRHLEVPLFPRRPLNSLDLITREKRHKIHLTKS